MSRFLLPRKPSLRIRAALCVGVCTAVALAAAACSSTSTPTSSDAAGHAVSATASPSPRGSASAGTIEITGAYLPQPATPDVAAAYFTIAEAGDQGDVLLSATSTPTAQAALMNESTTDGAETMTTVNGGLPIPAHGKVTLSPGGYHLMLTDPSSPLKQGDVVTLDLRFQHAGTVTLKVPVTALLSDAATGSDATAQASPMGDMPGMPGM